MQNWKKIFIGISVSLAAIAVFIFLIAYVILQRTLPEYDGEYKVLGLKSEVTIYRDSFAVPIIIAKEREDAAFALGYLHAQERLFQMDVARRAGEGRLSEVFGEKTIPIDKMFRTIGIYKHVEQTYNQLNPLTKKILSAYSKGVNASIQNSKGKYQVEFEVLGYDPYLWKPEHSLVIAKLMGWELNISWWSDVAFSNIIQKIGEENHLLHYQRE
jgi:penicillin amidase